MKNTGILLPTRYQFPSGVYILTANPRTSRAVSAEPREPATVEKRTKTGVLRLGSVRTLAIVYLESESSYTWKTPCAARVHHALRNPLVIEVLDLLAEDLIFHQRRAALAGTQRILVRA